MKILMLIIKQKYFDQILSGEKKVETRDISPRTIKKYQELDEKGDEMMEEDGRFVPRQYDAIRFYVGYRKDRDTALVEVKGAEIFLLQDENEELIEYEHNGKMHLMAQIDYSLGKVLEKQVKDKTAV